MRQNERLARRHTQSGFQIEQQSLALRRRARCDRAPALLLDPRQGRLRQRSLPRQQTRGRQLRRLRGVEFRRARRARPDPRRLRTHVERLHPRDEQTLVVAHFAQGLGHSDAADLPGNGETRGQRQLLMQPDDKLPFPVRAADKIAEAVELDFRIGQQPRLAQPSLGFVHGKACGNQITVGHQRGLHGAFQRQVGCRAFRCDGKQTDNGQIVEC